VTVFFCTLAIVSFFVTTIALREGRAARLGARSVDDLALLDAPHQASRERTGHHLSPPTGSPLGVAHAPAEADRR
jgi:hypothetical protein